MFGIEYIITGVLIAVFFMYSSRKASQLVEKNKEGKFHLRLNVIYKWMGIISVALGLAALIAPFFIDEEGIFQIFSVIIVMFSGIGIMLLMWYYNHQLIFDEEHIIVKSWTGKTRKIKWEEVDKIKFSPILGYLRVYSNSQKLNIHMHLVGLIEFVKMIEDKTEYKASDLKLP